MNDVEKLIELLERKQTEIYTDIEDLEGTEEYQEGFEQGWINAFDIAILIAKENSELFKRNDK